MINFQIFLWVFPFLFYGATRYDFIENAIPDVGFYEPYYERRTHLTLQMMLFQYCIKIFKYAEQKKSLDRVEF